MLADKFAQEELQLLRKYIDELLKAMDNREYVYCEGDEGYKDCCNCAEDAAVKLKKQLEGIIIDCGLYGEILNNFVESCGLKLTSSPIK
ncbi:MAG: hypothetical protein KME28_06100 [Pelatocladus maniniholoensis HA4357-MV3]|jgi:hypothetical protein|uniref:Uncharacterized protein n=1 Tax=Pelatocladus maniniholoensis HA4357-MV3 TaxID=1117104 RepID=A0A9E3H5T7_9NOST|nr:hypothetical protein [Pelatocladus maniniholoensis HA4357-MV3]